ncbi:D-alanyl-D-alanine carboxypeptidase/D-alanyl-D-alanine-endopeptidase [Chitinibacter fontanus]|uniref:D-alanyl-D-alanine carboxypeptidase/D-alanyl-D-alanine-endopeptidase n=1 Tax=Chitinibacter fontanus TaxID=1737446 RepID=A0A7D5Z8K5_9NEIS|nr:D-alanyl-D-alanine carboxypeptidase/D-alanyl-D-alanine-endopeptidase [Chitinibacter fontanus]QLI82603.1 D-alanyl-D-alanine carboxypeptidase/D-alanyl-D-alanine-endopeptidase [Chitinibacter fontanus]
MNFKNYPIKTLCCLLLMSSVVHADLPAKVAQSLKGAGIPSEAISVAIVPLEEKTGAQYHLADQPRNPASTMKLVTTWAGLHQLGPQWQWQTDLLATAAPVKGVLNGPLYLRGKGDPKLTLERMWLWVRDLKAAGVEDIRGPLVLDGSYFKRNDKVTEYDDDGDTERAFMVEPDALMSNFRTQRISFDSTGERVILRAEPPLNQVRVSNQLALSDAGNCATWAKRVQQRLGQVNGAEFLLQYVGEMPAGCKAERYVPVLNARTYTSALFWYLWYQIGGQGSGRTEDGVTPDNATILASTRSPDLVSNIRDINKFSNNLMARQLYLTLGAEQGKTAANTDEAGFEAIQNGLRAAGFNWSELVMENGSGLSRKEQISARHLADLLAHAWRSPYAAEYISSLPLVGLDGTMKKRLTDPAMAGMAHIKTGSLRDVRAVAGYVKDRKGKNWVVVGLVNHPDAAKALPALDSLIRSVAEK